MLKRIDKEKKKKKGRLRGKIGEQSEPISVPRLD